MTTWPDSVGELRAALEEDLETFVETRDGATHDNQRRDVAAALLRDLADKLQEGKT